MISIVVRKLSFHHAPCTPFSRSENWLSSCCWIEFRSHHPCKIKSQDSNYLNARSIFTANIEMHACHSQIRRARARCNGSTFIFQITCTGSWISICSLGMIKSCRKYANPCQLNRLLPVFETASIWFSFCCIIIIQFILGTVWRKPYFCIQIFHVY